MTGAEMQAHSLLVFCCLFRDDPSQQIVSCSPFSWLLTILPCTFPEFLYPLIFLNFLLLKVVLSLTENPPGHYSNQLQAITILQLTLEEILFSVSPKLSQHIQTYFSGQKMGDQQMVTKQQVPLRKSSTSLWNIEIAGIYYPSGFSQRQTESQFNISLHMSGTL